MHFKTYYLIVMYCAEGGSTDPMEIRLITGNTDQEVIKKIIQCLDEDYLYTKKITTFSKLEKILDKNFYGAITLLDTNNNGNIIINSGCEIYEKK